MGGYSEGSAGLHSIISDIPAAAVRNTHRQLLYSTRSGIIFVADEGGTTTAQGHVQLFLACLQFNPLISKHPYSAI